VKRKRRSQDFYVVECPVRGCDYVTWLWRSIRGAYAEFAEHLLEEHDGSIEFIGEGDE